MSKQAYRLMGGSYVERGSDHKYQKGDLVFSTSDLKKAFPGMFKRVKATEPAPPVAPPVHEAPEFDEDDEEEEEEFEEALDETTVSESTGNPLGDNVTEAFPNAHKNGLMVFKTGVRYSVADVDAPTVALNKTQLKSKKQVVDFVESYLDG